MEPVSMNEPSPVHCILVALIALLVAPLASLHAAYFQSLEHLLRSCARPPSPRCGRPARRAVSGRARADEKNPALSVDRRHTVHSTLRRFRSHRDRCSGVAFGSRAQCSHRRVAHELRRAALFGRAGGADDDGTHSFPARRRREAPLNHPPRCRGTGPSDRGPRATRQPAGQPLIGKKRQAEKQADKRCAPLFSFGRRGRRGQTAGWASCRRRRRRAATREAGC